MEILHNGVSPIFFINPQKLRLEFEYIIIGGRKNNKYIIAKNRECRLLIL